MTDAVQAGRRAWPASRIYRRLLERHYALIVVAEGAGADFVPTADERDASSNLKRRDIGLFLKQKLRTTSPKLRFPVVIRYIDPSSYIQSVPASTVDSVMCDSSARRALHAAMAGKTDMIISPQHGMFIHVPIPMATVGRKRLSA